MPTTFNYSGKPAYMYDSAEDVWFQIGGAIDTSSGYTWTGTHAFSNDVNFTDAVFSAEGINNFLNPAARDAKFASPVRGNICFVRQDAGGSALNQIQFYDGTDWVAGGDITAVTGGTGITATNSTGPIPSLAVDTNLVATTSNTMTMSNKTLTAPTIQGASVTGGTFIGAAITSSTLFAVTSTNETLAYPILISPEERMAVTSASASTNNVTLNTDTAGTLYFTGSASSNHVINVRHSSNTSLNSVLTTGDSITVVWLNTNGATAYYPNVFQVDGATSGVSVKWQGGTAPSSGNASSIDAYVYNIIKTAATSYTVLASQTKFA